MTGGMMGLAVGSTIARPRPRRDVSVPAAAVGARAGRVREGGREGPARGARATTRLERRYDFEDDRTFGEFLGPLPPRRARDLLLRRASRDRGARTSSPPAAGSGCSRSCGAGKGSLIARNLLGGTGRLPAALGPRARRARPHRLPRATPSRPDGAELVVVLRRRGDPRAARDRGRAGAACRAARRARSPSGPPPRCAQLTYGAFLSVAVETSETTAMPYDDVYAIATPGRVFDMFTNQAHALRAAARAGPAAA